jgi:hypothetical protein
MANVSFLGPINQSFPSVNGIEPSWSDINATAIVDGGPLVFMSAISAIKWSRKVEVGVRRGASGGRVMARTTGEGSQEASCTFYRSGLRDFITSLIPFAPMRANQAAISLVSFDVMIQHTPPGELTIYETKLAGCRYLGDSDDMKEGSDPDHIEVSLNPIYVANIINGIEVVLL